MPGGTSVPNGGRIYNGPCQFRRRLAEKPGDVLNLIKIKNATEVVFFYFAGTKGQSHSCFTLFEN